MARVTTRTLAAISVAALVSAYAIAQADGAPSASTTAANSMIGTASVLNGPEPGSYRFDGALTGKVTAASHKSWVRRCRAGREIHIETRLISGRTQDVGDTYPSSRSGHFEGSFPMQYGGTDSDGNFSDGNVAYSGGSATFYLSTGSISVPKDRLGFRSYRCRPLALTVQMTGIPAVPPP